MEVFWQFLREFRGIYTVWLMVLTVGIGIFILLQDVHSIEKKSGRDSSIAKIVGWSYSIGGVLLFLILYFID